MNPLGPALAWALAAVLAALVLPRLQRRRLMAVAPLAPAVVVVASMPAGPDRNAVAAVGGLSLGRPALALILVCALACTVALVLARTPGTGEVLVLAACGALAAVLLATGSPELWAVAVLAAAAVIGIRVVTTAPGRPSLAAARALILGAAALLAAAPLLPIGDTTLPIRSHLVGALLGGALVALLGLSPLSGWVRALPRTSGEGGMALAPWLLLLVPAVLVTVQPLQVILPAPGRASLGAVMLPVGAATAGWSALRGLAGPAADLYRRVISADLGLCAMGLATPNPAARLGTLLLVLAHLSTAPLLLQETAVALDRQRRLCWLALSGVPPSPAFWGRFALTTALLSAFGSGTLFLALPVGAALLGVCLRAIASPAAAEVDPGPAARSAAWLAVAAALAVGLLPDATLRALFGLA